MATNQWRIVTLSQAPNSLSATSVGNFALFADGGAGDALNVVDMYDSATNRWTTATLSQARLDLQIEQIKLVVVPKINPSHATVITSFSTINIIRFNSIFLPREC